MTNVVDEHVRTAAGELEGDGAADAASTAGDQCELASELAAHFSRVALTLRSTLPFNAWEMGQPSLAASAAF